MDIQVQHNENTSAIIIEKDQLLGKENETFQAIVKDLIEHGSKNILVDLTKVKFITSWAIESFIHAYKMCMNKNIDFRLKNVNSNVKNILSTLRLDSVIKIV